VGLITGGVIYSLIRTRAPVGQKIAEQTKA
jgi:hypothetical protein